MQKKVRMGQIEKINTNCKLGYLAAYTFDWSP